jgi:hypothetical protein
VVAALGRNNAAESSQGLTEPLVNPNPCKLRIKKALEAMRGNAPRMYIYCVAPDARLAHRISIEKTRLVSDVRDSPRQDGGLEDFTTREGKQYVLLGCGDDASALPRMLELTRVL